MTIWCELRQEKIACATFRMPQTADAWRKLMNWKNVKVLKIFTELPIHAQLNTKYRKILEVEFDIYIKKYVQ
jgi:hypothetical protein